MVALIRRSREPVSFANPDGVSRLNLPLSVVWEQILIPFTLVAFGVSWLFARPDKPFFNCPVVYLDGVFDPARWGNSTAVSALLFGLLVGVMRLLTFAVIEVRNKLRLWKLLETLGAGPRRLSRALSRGRRWRVCSWR